MLFNIALETLAETLREGKNIEGVMVQNIELKIAVCTDDVVCFLGNPCKSMLYLTDVLNEFGMVAGYRVNQAKPVFLGFNISIQLQEEILHIMLTMWTDDNVKYLGIRLLKSKQKWIEYNVIPVKKW